MSRSLTWLSPSQHIFLRMDGGLAGSVSGAAVMLWLKGATKEWLSDHSEALKLALRVFQGDMLAASFA